MYTFNNDWLCHNFGNLNLSLFVYTFDDILLVYPKYPLCIYVLPQDDPRRPNM